MLKQMLQLLVLFPELPEDQGPICCRHHFLWKGQRILTCKNKRHLIKVPVTTMSTTANWHSLKCIWLIMVMIPSMSDEQFHGFLHSGSKRIFTRQKQKQLGWGQLQQHACDFAGKGLWTAIHTQLVTEVFIRLLHFIISFTDWWIKSRSNQVCFHLFQHLLHNSQAKI